MCKILCVSVSGYYKYRRNLGKPSKDDVLSAAMQDILNESPYNDNYGAPRMQLALLQRNLKAGIRRITRIMREHGWLHKPRRKPKGLTHATTEIQEKENVVAGIVIDHVRLSSFNDSNDPVLLDECGTLDHSSSKPRSMSAPASSGASSMS